MTAARPVRAGAGAVVALLVGVMAGVAVALLVLDDEDDDEVAAAVPPMTTTLEKVIESPMTTKAGRRS